ncbi:hypothetical protein ElyMa_005756100 [Elysia marginata]|uniref:Uncharacterized protein n=1 Tax=Elysia marginata TaxID=1093978 RepID=A0AAV4FMI8_9GAST|nr:hypothetical protein ElyMa_005756100 [Elysia marginata]
MLPGGFKKDSRVWLHKNSSAFQKKAPFCKCDGEGQRIGMDDPYDCLSQDPYICSEPLLTDASGRIYKKDSRTWLHKSSRKKMRSPRAGAQMEDGNRVGWKLDGHGLSAGEAQEGVVVRTRSSAELLRLQSGTNKIKKKKTMVLMSMIVTPPTSGGAADTCTTQGTRQRVTGNHKYRACPLRASYHDVSGTCKGCSPISAFASDLCIAGKERSPSKLAAQDHFADSDCDNYNCDYDDDEDDDENNGDDLIEDDEMEDVNTRSQKQRMNTRRPCHGGGVGRGGGGGLGGGGCGTQRATWNNTTVEITKDGLRELEKMMKEQQSQRRSARLAKSLPDRQTPGCDVSPETLSSDSRVSLNANVNLSEEMMCGRHLNQSQNSAEQQLTQATEFLHVCSPDRHRIKRNLTRYKKRSL